MSESMGMIVVFGVVGLLVLLAAYRFMAQRRQLSSGREVGRFRPTKKDGKMIFDHQVVISEGGTWCRLLLSFKAQGGHHIDQSPQYMLKRVTLIVGTSYILAITDALGRILYGEKNTLDRFVAWLGGRQESTGTMLSEQGSGTHEGTVTFLEFLPQETGRYWISLEIQTREERRVPGSWSFWEVLQAELVVMEGVEPLSQTVKYPHARVVL